MSILVAPSFPRARVAAAAFGGSILVLGTLLLPFTFYLTDPGPALRSVVLAVMAFVLIASLQWVFESEPTAGGRSLFGGALAVAAVGCIVSSLCIMASGREGQMHAPLILGVLVLMTVALRVMTRSRIQFYAAPCAALLMVASADWRTVVALTVLALVLGVLIEHTRRMAPSSASAA